MRRKVINVAKNYGLEFVLEEARGGHDLMVADMTFARYPRSSPMMTMRLRRASTQCAHDKAAFVHSDVLSSGIDFRSTQTGHPTALHA